MLATPEMPRHKPVLTVMAWLPQQPLPGFLVVIFFQRVTKGISQVRGVLRSVFVNGAAFAKVLVKYESVSVLK